MGCSGRSSKHEDGGDEALRAPASSQEGLELIREAGWVTVVTLR